jgi:CitB family two-component system response regulator CitT
MINVLIVEDDFRIANFHEELLKKMRGIQVVGKALNASEAMELLVEHQVELILLDMYMPDKLGIEVMDEVRRLYPQIEFIVITAATEKELLENSLRSGVFGYLIKPVKVDKFTEVIEKFKHRKQLLDSRKDVDQEFIDQLLHSSTREEQKDEPLPKGINLVTLNKVIRLMGKFENGVTVEEMGEEMGASRTTARRYLEYLVSIEKLKATIEYGIVGRPERKYFQ